MADDFFEDLDKTVAHLTQTALLGQDIETLAQETEKSANLLYQWTYPDRPQKPSLKSFLKIIRNSPQRERVLKEICRAFGMIGITKNGNISEILKIIAEEMEGK